MSIHLLPFICFSACVPSSVTPTLPATPPTVDSGDVVDTSDTGSRTLVWASAGSGSWPAPADSPCATVHATVVGTAAGRDAWLQGFADGPLGDSVVPDVDWPNEAMLLTVTECTNTDKELQITSVQADSSALLAGVELRHPGIDGALETTYWAAASVPPVYAGAAVTVELNEVFDEEPP